MREYAAVFTALGNAAVAATSAVTDLAEVIWSGMTAVRRHVELQRGVQARREQGVLEISEPSTGASDQMGVTPARGAFQGLSADIAWEDEIQPSAHEIGGDW